MGMEIEDDVFYADLSRQITLLIMDDDEVDGFPVQIPPVHAQGYHHQPHAMMPPPFMYEMSYRRESKGTGVFIPRSSLPSRKNRSGKSNPANTTPSQSQPDKSGVAVSRAANTDRLNSGRCKNPGSRKNRGA